MKPAFRLSLGCFVALVLGAVSACGGGSSSAASSARLASPSAKAVASPAGPAGLDPAVPMPNGFPADIPVYSGARLTAGATFSAGGTTTWGMEWETLDSVAKVQAFYSSKLSEGDWNIQFSGTANGSFSAIFNRKSKSSAAGIVGADGSSGVTKISLSFASPS
jgi:hypothetical protein